MSPRLSKQDLKSRRDFYQNLFPRTKINFSRKPSEYQARKIKHLFDEIAGGKILLLPDEPEIYVKAGFIRMGNYILTDNSKVDIHTLYHAEGICEFYSANISTGDLVHAQLIPTIKLPDFLEEQAAVDEEQGQFYDLITLRENSSNLYKHTSDSAEELLLWLSQGDSIRKGALAGGDEANTYEYIQVCYIQLR
jgi:hypothetical protein